MDLPSAQGAAIGSAASSQASQEQVSGQFMHVFSCVHQVIILNLYIGFPGKVY